MEEVFLAFSPDGMTQRPLRPGLKQPCRKQDGIGVLRTSGQLGKGQGSSPNNLSVSILEARLSTLTH